MPFERFVDIVQRKNLYFVDPFAGWDDSYEGFLFRAMQSQEGKEKIRNIAKGLSIKGVFSSSAMQIISAILTQDMLNRVRYLCWSTAKDSVAMWSIYNYSKRSIMICTTSEKLELLNNDEQKVELMNIEYVPTLSLETEIERAFSKSPFHIPEIFIVKRSEFSHEQEIRAHIGIGANQPVNPGDGIRIKIPNIQDFIEGVQVHPLAEDWFVEVVKQYCELNQITFLGKSRIYEFEC